MEIWRLTAGLVVVFVLLGAALWAWGERPGGARARGSKSRSLTASERVALTPQHVLHLVRTSTRELVVATHPRGCSVLLDEPWPGACADSPGSRTAQGPGPPVSTDAGPRAGQVHASREKPA